MTARSNGRPSRESRTKKVSSKTPTKRIIGNELESCFKGFHKWPKVSLERIDITPYLDKKVPLPPADTFSNEVANQNKDILKRCGLDKFNLKCFVDLARDDLKKLQDSLSKKARAVVSPRHTPSGLQCSETNLTAVNLQDPLSKRAGAGVSPRHTPSGLQCHKKNLTSSAKLQDDLSKKAGAIRSPRHTPSGLQCNETNITASVNLQDDLLKKEGAIRSPRHTPSGLQCNETSITASVNLQDALAKTAGASVSPRHTPSELQCNTSNLTTSVNFQDALSRTVGAAFSPRHAPSGLQCLKSNLASSSVLREPKPKKRVSFSEMVTVIEMREYHKCKKCPRIFDTRKLLKTHIKKTHKKNRQYICNYCQKSFMDRSFFKVHIKLHCNVCGLLLPSKAKCLEHRRKVCRVLHKCKLCDKSFFKQKHLREHNYEHSKLRFFCDFCKDKFKTKCAIAHHLKFLHSKRRPRSLYEMRSLGTDRLYLCNFCDESTVERELIEKHIRPLPDLSNRIIKGQKGYYFCDQCKKDFLTEKKMLEHKWTHFLKISEVPQTAEPSNPIYRSQETTECNTDTLDNSQAMESINDFNDESQKEIQSIIESHDDTQILELITNYNKTESDGEDHDHIHDVDFINDSIGRLQETLKVITESSHDMQDMGSISNTNNGCQNMAQSTTDSHEDFHDMKSINNTNDGLENVVQSTTKNYEVFHDIESMNTNDGSENMVQSITKNNDASVDMESISNMNDRSESMAKSTTDSHEDFHDMESINNTNGGLENMVQSTTKNIDDFRDMGSTIKTSAGSQIMTQNTTENHDNFHDMEIMESINNTNDGSENIITASHEDFQDMASTIETKGGSQIMTQNTTKNHEVFHDLESINNTNDGSGNIITASHDAFQDMASTVETNGESEVMTQSIIESHGFQNIESINNFNGESQETFKEITKIHDQFPNMESVDNDESVNMVQIISRSPDFHDMETMNECNGMLQETLTSHGVYQDMGSIDTNHASQETSTAIIESHDDSQNMESIQNTNNGSPKTQNDSQKIDSISNLNDVLQNTTFNIMDSNDNCKELEPLHNGDDGSQHQTQNIEVSQFIETNNNHKDVLQEMAQNIIHRNEKCQDMESVTNCMEPMNNSISRSHLENHGDSLESINNSSDPNYGSKETRQSVIVSNNDTQYISKSILSTYNDRTISENVLNRAMSEFQQENGSVESEKPGNVLHPQQSHQPMTFLEQMLLAPSNPPSINNRTLDNTRTVYRFNEVPPDMLKLKVVLQKVKLNGKKPLEEKSISVNKSSANKTSTKDVLVVGETRKGCVTTTVNSGDSNQSIQKQICHGRVVKYTDVRDSSNQRNGKLNSNIITALDTHRNHSNQETDKNDSNISMDTDLNYINCIHEIGHYDLNHSNLDSNIIITIDPDLSPSNSGTDVSDSNFITALENDINHSGSNTMETDVYYLNSNHGIDEYDSNITTDTDLMYTIDFNDSNTCQCTDTVSRLTPYIEEKITNGRVSMDDVPIVEAVMDTEYAEMKKAGSDKKSRKILNSKHQCLVCGKYFSSGYCMRRHIRDVHTDSLQCMLCEEVFVWPSLLQSHKCIRLQHPEMPFQDARPEIHFDNLSQVTSEDFGDIGIIDNHSLAVDFEIPEPAVRYREQMGSSDVSDGFIEVDAQTGYVNSPPSNFAVQCLSPVLMQAPVLRNNLLQVPIESNNLEFNHIARNELLQPLHAQSDVFVQTPNGLNNLVFAVNRDTFAHNVNPSSNVQCAFAQNGIMQNPFASNGTVQNTFTQNGLVQAPFAQNVIVQSPFSQNVIVQSPFTQNVIVQSQAGNVNGKIPLDQLQRLGYKVVMQEVPIEF